MWSSDALWRHRPGSTLAQLMACCLRAPCHYLNQCWLIISKVQWQTRQKIAPLKSCPDPLRTNKLIQKQTLTPSHWQWSYVSVALTLSVQRLSYHSLIRSISWLLLSWLLASPGHQQPRYWLCEIGKFLSFTRKDFNYRGTCVMSLWKNDRNCK